ncbi:uncharacterized protein AB675_462 [Cyphellophora attinorum]|uniref:Uncharacterized protein n=1 Tax=Cyphellophora attinorum TaxID=1664694 RepID=A0A0N1HHI4_9EURO|nr:uncharacterized protein AB675_462 [Phialophora attinorum]KPI45992.1 hypothetical protein AB675_462 [Phialophora attinorum]
MLTLPTAYRLLTLVSLTYSSPTQASTNVIPYMPQDYTYRGGVKDPKSGLDLNPTVMIPRYNEDKWLNFCARYDNNLSGFWIAGNKASANTTCYQDKNVLSEDPTTKPAGVKVWPKSSAPGRGPCVQLLTDNHALANERAGWWPGRNVNCVLFWTNNCVYDYKSDSGTYLPNSPATVLPPPGMAVFEAGPWQDSTLNSMWFKDPFSKNDRKTASGPSSYKCYIRGQTFDGNNKDSPVGWGIKPDDKSPPPGANARNLHFGGEGDR